VANPTPVRRLLVLALGALLVAPAPSRAAGLGADLSVSGEAHFNIFGTDHASYLIDLVVRSSEAGTRTGETSATVTVRRCLGVKCSRVTYLGALPTGSFTVAQDLSSGSLVASLFGRPLFVTWEAPQGPTLPSYELTPDGPRASVRLYQVTRTSGFVMGRACRSKDALVSRAARVDADSPADKPLPRAVPRALAGMAKGRCSNPTS
jgi:hypothetical protein